MWTVGLGADRWKPISLFNQPHMPVIGYPKGERCCPGTTGRLNSSRTVGAGEHGLWGSGQRPLLVAEDSVGGNPWAQVKVLKTPKVCPEICLWLVQSLPLGLFPLLPVSWTLPTALLPCPGKMVCSPQWPPHILTSFPVHQLRWAAFY